MGTVRRFSDGDIPLVADLHRRVFGISEDNNAPLLGAYGRYFRQVFLSGPGAEGPPGSLVYEEDDGTISGFIGVVARRMTHGGRPLHAALSSQFVVDPAARRRLVGVQLLRAVLAGPQDLSIADEARPAGRRLWEGLGGATAHLYSLYWTRPLRPLRLALSFLGRRRALAPVARLGGPVARCVDGLAARIPQSHVYQAPPKLAGEELSPRAFLSYLPAFAGERVLRPEYDETSLSWAFARLAGTGGNLRRVLVRDPGSGPVGWYVYFPRPGDTGEVVQVAAAPGRATDVLSHMFYDAWQQGALALSGRLQPSFMQALSDRYSLLHRRGPFTLVHSRRPELLHAFASGEAFLTPLDGERCLHFA